MQQIQKILKNIFNLDFLWLILGNLYLSHVYILLFFGIIIMGFTISIKEKFVILDQAFVSLMFLNVLMIFLSLVFVLPVLYSELENKSKNELVLKFIHSLKTNFWTKIVVLCLTMLLINPKLFENLNNFKDIFHFIIFGLIGITGSYIVLFIWWKIENKIKNCNIKFVKNIFSLDFFWLIFWNIFSIVVVFFVFVFYFFWLSYIPKGNNETSILISISTLFIASLVIVASRLFVLPVLYSELENKSKNELVLKFIHSLKTNFWTKIVVLCLTMLPYFVVATGTSNNIKTNILSFIFNAILIGATGSYIVLFIWWKIKDKKSPKI